MAKRSPRSMGHVSLLYGLPFSGQREGLLSRVLEHLSRHPGAPAYVLLPTHEGAVELNRAILDACPSRAAIGLRVGTLELAAQSLFSRLAYPRRPMGSLERRLIAASVLDHSRFPELTAAAARGEGTVRRLCGFISLMKTSMRPARLVEEAIRRKGPVGAAWERELLPFFEAYQSRLAELGLLDPEDVLAIVAEALRSGELRLPAHSLVALHGFFHLAPLELAFAAALLQSADSAMVSLHYHPEAHEKLAASGALFQFIQELSKEESSRTSASWHEAAFFGLPEGKASQLAGRVELAQEFDLRSEVESVAAAVKSLLRSDPSCMPSDIKVVTNDLDVYAPVFREVFSSYGIPLRIPAGKPLGDSAVVAAAMALLEAPLQDFSRHSVLRILSMPCVKLPDAERLFRRELADRVARAAGMTQGYEEWQSRLQQLQPLLESEPEQDPEYFDPLDEEVDRLRSDPGPKGFPAIERALIDFLRKVKSVDEPLPPAEFCRRYVELIEHFGIGKIGEGGVETCASASQAEAVMALTRFMTILRELTSALELSSPAPRPLQDYYRLLRSAISFERVDEAPSPSDGVELHWGSQSATIPARHVFVVGATESSFPGTEPSPAFHSAEELRSLGILTDPSHQSQSRFLFYSYLASASETVRISWPASEGDRPLLRSPFVDELAAAASLQVSPCVRREPAAGQTLSGICAQIGLSAVGEEEGRGAARLLSALDRRHPAVASGLRRGLAFWRAKASSPALNPFNGLISAPDLMQALRHPFREACFAVTRLEAYAACPFRFLFEHLIRLSPPAEPEEAVSPLNWGSAVHRAFKAFMLQRRAVENGRTVFAKIPTPEEDPKGFQDAAAELAALLEKELERLPRLAEDAYYLSLRDNMLGVPPPHPDQGFIKAFLSGEARRQASGIIPHYFELYFGPGHPKGSDALLKGRPFRVSGAVEGEPLSISLLGEIDRVDVLPQSGVVVYDYKTGASKPPGQSEIKQGMALQLPIYLLAAREILRHAGFRGAQPFAAAYVHVRDSAEAEPQFVLRAGLLPHETEARTRRLPDAAALSALLENSARYALAYASGILSGLFPATPASERASCGYCDYRALCRSGEMGIPDVAFPVSVDGVELHSCALDED